MNEPWPRDEVAVADHKTTQLAFLGHRREFLIRKAVGLTEVQARTASCPPSDLTMLGLARHAAEVERGGRSARCSVSTSDPCTPAMRIPTEASAAISTPGGCEAGRRHREVQGGDKRVGSCLPDG